MPVIAGSSIVPLVSPASVVDIFQLAAFTVADMTPEDATAYDALDVPSMSSGDSFNDPVTGVLTTKITDNSTPTVNDFSATYATIGLQIGGAWGLNGDQYTFGFFRPTGGITWLVDYQLGGIVSNFRLGPAGESQWAFSRVLGNERIMYIVNGTQLRRYDTSIDAFADTGDFPYTWTTLGGAGSWLQVNADDTRATAMLSTGGGSESCTSLDLTDGTVITQTVNALDELYVSGDVAFLSTDPAMEPEKHWDLITDTITELDIPSGWQALVHSPTPGDFLFHSDMGQGTNMRSTRILDSNVAQPEVLITGYWPQHHSCGHWQDFPPGTNPTILWSSNNQDQPWTDSWERSLVLIDTITATKYLLGHHYSILWEITPSSTYWSHAFANQSNDGKLVMFTSTMNEEIRSDVFIMEVPRT